MTRKCTSPGGGDGAGGRCMPNPASIESRPNAGNVRLKDSRANCNAPLHQPQLSPDSYRKGLIDKRVLGGACILGIVVCVADALIDYLVFYEGSFLELLITNVPEHELYIRSLTMVSYVVFGTTLGIVVGRLRQNEESYRGLFDDALDMIHTVDRSGTIRDANKAELNTLGYEKEELIGKKLLDLIHPDYAEETAERLGRIWAGEKVGRYETVLLTKRGESIYVEVAATPSRADGHVTEARAIIRDVSESRRLMARMRELARFPEENPNPVLRIAADGTVMYANKAANCLLQKWGCSPGGSVPEAWRNDVARSLESATPSRREESCCGTVYMFTVAPISDAGFANLYGLDITALRQAEAQVFDAQRALAAQQAREREAVEAELKRIQDELVRKTRLAAIGQVSASIAHDLRNPLASVRNAAFILSRRIGDDKRRLKKNIEIIEQEVARADHIITNLLMLTRESRPQKEDVDQIKIVRDIFDKTNTSTSIRCELSLEHDPFIVYADPRQLEQVVANVVSNAVDAMGSQGVFGVEARHETDYDTIVFSDTGPGLNGHVCDAIFEPLVTTKTKGTGLGLTICKQIVEAHDGSIEAKQRIGGGTQFEIRLPPKQHD